MSNLLLVDDDDFVRNALSRALNRTGGFTVIPAEHGKRALELLATEHVDAILTDLQMPVMDGLTLLAELFEKEIRLPVAVMLTPTKPASTNWNEWWAASPWRTTF